MVSAQSPHAKGFQDERYRRLIQALATERKRQGLSQEQLAKRLNRHQQFVSRYEIGERRLDVIEFMDVAKGLAIDPIGMLETVDFPPN